MANDTATQLDHLTDSFRAAVDRQRQDTDPAHEDMYVWGWALSELTALTQHAAQVLGRQVAAYGEMRLLRDDEDGDPYARLADARAHLDALATALIDANGAAQRYHSAVGHIAVEVDPGGGR